MFYESFIVFKKKAEGDAFLHDLHLFFFSSLQGKTFGIFWQQNVPFSIQNLINFLLIMRLKLLRAFGKIMLGCLGHCKHVLLDVVDLE